MHLFSFRKTHTSTGDISVSSFASSHLIFGFKTTIKTFTKNSCVVCRVVSVNFVESYVTFCHRVCVYYFSVLNISLKFEQFQTLMVIYITTIYCHSLVVTHTRSFRMFRAHDFVQICGLRVGGRLDVHVGCRSCCCSIQLLGGEISQRTYSPIESRSHCHYHYLSF